MKAGVYSGLSNNAYHEADGISKSQLDLIAKSPAHLKFALDHPELVVKDTPSIRRGSLIHAMVLEPDTVPERYVVQPENIKRRQGKAWEEFREEAGNREILTPQQQAEANMMVRAILSNPEAEKIIERAENFELSVFAEDFETDELVKCRPDIVMPDGLWLYDLKTTSNATDRSFSYSCRDFRYHVQSAYYPDVCEMAGFYPEGFGFIVVDTQDMPYQCTVFHKMEDEAVEKGRALYRRDLNLYAECKAKDEWPGYPESYDVITIGGYAYDAEEPCE